MAHGLTRPFYIILLLIAFAENNEASGVLGEVSTAFFTDSQRALALTAIEVKVGQTGEERRIRIAPESPFESGYGIGHGQVCYYR